MGPLRDGDYLRMRAYMRAEQLAKTANMQCVPRRACHIMHPFLEEDSQIPACVRVEYWGGVRDSGLGYNENY